VRCVITALNPSEGGVELLRKVWQTECRGFKNESQNYSQIALATQLQFDQLLMQDGDTVYLVQGDKYFHRYDRKQKPTEAYIYLNNCLDQYETDLVEGVLPYNDFMKRITLLHKEYTRLARSVAGGMEVTLNPYPATADHINQLAYSLTKKQRYEEALALLKLNVEMHPTSAAAHDSLARAYFITGNRQLAEMHSSKSMALSKKEN
jgi:tetratricopeptide (TPR) repeat protein